MDIDKDDITTVTITEAAEELGVSPNAINQLIQRDKIPAEKIGRQWRVERDIIRSVADLKKKYGKSWSKYAPWNGGPSFIKNDTDDEETAEKSGDQEAIERVLNGKLLKLSREYREAGLYDQALKLQDMVLEQYDFG